MNILSLFPLIPLVMMLGLWISKNTRQIHAVMVAGSSALLALAIYLVFHYLGLREAGATDAMLLTDSVVWYAPLNIHYAVSHQQRPDGRACGDSGGPQVWSWSMACLWGFA